MAGRVDEGDLAATLAEIARTLMSGTPTAAETLDRIVLSACATVPGCAHASISVIGERTITTPAASDDVPMQVDAIQYDADQGPGLDAIRDHESSRPTTSR